MARTNTVFLPPPMFDSIRQRSRALSAALAAVALFAALPAAAQTDHTTWSRNETIYEVNVRQYTAEGTIRAFATHLPRLDSLGATTLWLMPIHPIGQQNRLGSLGSPYAVRDYRAVNPAFGTLADVKALVDSAHARGMHVLLDWVANHTAWDNGLTSAHPDWYVRDGSGRFIAPPGTNWSDVIELDYNRPELRRYMIDAMRFWVTETGIDGFRFDAAAMVPTDFWRQASAELLALRPDLFLLAEDGGTQWASAGMHASYGWSLYGFGGGLLPGIVRGTKSAYDLQTLVATEAAAVPRSSYRLYFTSNHDENSWQGTPTELFGAAAPAFAVLTATLGGMPLVYGGQEAGLDRRLAFFDKDRITWRAHANARLYERLLHLKARNEAMWNGAAGGAVQRLASSNDSYVFAFAREKNGARVVVALNLSSTPQRATLGGGDLATPYVGTYRDVLTGATLAEASTVTLSAGAELVLPAWGYVVYEATGPATAADASPVLPAAASLDAVAPNPVRADAQVRYTLAAPATVRLVVTDALGREVLRLDDGLRGAGPHAVALDGTGLADGVYLVTLSASAAPGAAPVRLTRRFVRVH